MDIVQHAVEGYYIGYWTKNKAITYISAFLGALPDLIGFAEKVFKWDWGVWNWYHWSHTLTWWNIPILPYSLHIFLDSFIHPIGPLYWVFEIVGWLVCIWLVYITKGAGRE